MTDIASVAESARKIFAASLSQCFGHQDTAGTCLFGAVLCAKMINQFTDATAVIRGGDGECDGGVFIDGVGHGHYWVEAQTTDSVIVVDVTGDQFGLPPVVVAPIEHCPAAYVPGCQETVDRHVRETLPELAD
ncbi:hypothetical protein [Pseudomonas grimontii]|uniref:hypothetical protein n=1 Tax=Pseudomonas grimontii TaxID=129847 RepID=UPI00387B309E